MIPVFAPTLFMPQPASGVWTGPTSGLVSQWWLDDSHVSGTTITDSGSNNNTGTASGGVSSTSSPAGGFYSTARAFDGGITTGIKLASSSTDWTSDFTLAMWLNVVDVSAAGSSAFRATFFYSDKVAATNWMRVLNDTNVNPGFVGFSQSGAGLVVNAQALFNNTWCHIGYTFASSGSVKALYINGSSVATSAETAGDNSDSSAWIGAMALDATGLTPAGDTPSSLYNIVLYNRALSSGEMTTLYNATEI